jgi:homoserine kinase type II
MAVYTTFENSELVSLLQDYDIGDAIDLRAIEQGIENSNYFLTTTTGKYILTIYEKRVKLEELPFYLNLMEHLSRKNIPCPIPIKNKYKNNFSSICNRPCAIISFLDGRSTQVIRNEHLMELGHNLARMHIAAQDFDIKHNNNFSLAFWQKTFNSIKSQADLFHKGLASEIEKQLIFLSDNWPSNLDTGIVHADLFPDNVFFSNDKLVGIIDYYFACNDFLMYDVAVCLNAWCFESNNEFNITKAKKLLSSYNKVRQISERELDALPVLATGAALRFLLTRLYDWFNKVEGAIVRPKNPIEYIEKMRFHNGIQSHKEYGL